MNPISGNKVTLSKVITSMTKADAMAPIAALEATVVLGRTYQAHKRGGIDEARERFIEESSGSIVWLCGVGAMNALGDKLVNKILKTTKNFDVGTDKVLRTPFENFMKNIAHKGFSAKQVALIKGAKVLTSVIITNLFIGFVVPKLNQGLTNRLKGRREKLEELKAQHNPSFKGAGINAINVFTNAIENTNTGKLLSSDAGIAGGRMYNARTKEERREIAIRDIGSIYFYMWAQGHVRNLLNLAQTGNSTRLNPATAETLNKHLLDYIKDNKMNVNEFKNAVLGKNIELPNEISFETAKPSVFDKLFKRKPLEVVKLSEAEKHITDSKILERAREMAKLQPKRMDDLILTKQQLVDAFNIAEINDPKFLDEVFSDFTQNANKDKFKYVSNKSLYNLKDEMIKYVEYLCKQSKDGKIDKALIEKVQKKNLIYNGINFAAGFSVAAIFLSYVIPKIQYYVTKKTTGIDAFPGLYDYSKNNQKAK